MKHDYIFVMMRSIEFGVSYFNYYIFNIKGKLTLDKIKYQIEKIKEEQKNDNIVLLNIIKVK